MKRFVIFRKNSEMNTLEKGGPHKYLRKIPTGKTSRPWYYIYESTFLKPFSALKSWFGLSEKTVTSDYEKNNISKDYGVDKKTFAAHVLEFFTNKDKWNSFFMNRANREKNKKPIKQDKLQPKASAKIDGTDKTKPVTKEKKKSLLNRSLMRKVWTIYSPQGQAIAEKEKAEKPIDKVEDSPAPSDVIANSLKKRENVELKYDGSDKNALRIHRKNIVLGNVIPEYGEDGKITGGKLVSSTSYFNDWEKTKKEILEYYDLTKPNTETLEGTTEKKQSKKELFEKLKATVKETGYIPNGELESLSVENIEQLTTLAKQIESVPGMYNGDHTAMLHYFTPDADYYVTELGDDGEAFGYVDKNGDPSLSEFGYFNIKELVDETNKLTGSNALKGAQIDLYFEPKDIKDLLKDSGHDELYNHYVSVFENEEPEETEQEKTENRSNAMMGNQNARKNIADKYGIKESLVNVILDFIRVGNSDESTIARLRDSGFDNAEEMYNEIKNNPSLLQEREKELFDDKVSQGTKWYNIPESEWLEHAKKMYELSVKYDMGYIGNARLKDFAENYNLTDDDMGYINSLLKYTSDKSDTASMISSPLGDLLEALKETGRHGIAAGILEIPESDAEKHQNRSNAMLGNDNAKKDGIIDNGGTGNGRTQNRSNGLSSVDGKVRNEPTETDSDSNVYPTETGSNTGEFVQQSRQSGIGLGDGSSNGTDTGTGYTVGTGRLSKTQAKKIREQCRQILEKSDSEITDKDKEILAQYEGAGGLHEGDQTNAAVLSEFYTPRDVISKVWELVNKYIPNTNKKVIEPSSGIGRFAEGRPENFTLCELDETSSRIAKLLHPKATVKQGAFQEMFVKNNSVQKNYTGEKFDVAVGNPPYGEYTGFYKGIGEGKIHTRYEEYFIDRTLDTLRDGGILAFVVPSGFLRGKDSAAKQAIAEKGKLLEAWRLPKGTFSSTDVGTDVIVIQKGKGNVADYNDNNYFTKYENHVIGNETDGGNWGTKIINLPEGKTVAEAIDMIDVNAVSVDEEIAKAAEMVEVKKTTSNKKFVVIGNLEEGAEIVTQDGKKGTITAINRKNGMIGYTVKDGPIGRTKIDDFEVADDQETAEEIHRNRSEAMKGNDNAKKAIHKEKVNKAKKGDIFTPSSGINMSAEEFNKKYNKSIASQDIKFWKVTDWEGNINTTSLSEKELNELSNNPNFINVDGKYKAVVNYASGNIYDKLQKLEEQKDEISEQDYKERKAILENALPEPKTIEQFTISPIANFAKQVKNEDGLSLADQFLKYCGFNDWGNVYDSPIPRSELDDGMTIRDIWEYIHQVPVRTERARTPEDKETAKMEAEQRKTSRRETTERLFNDWLRTKIPANEQERIAKLWNERFNAYVNPDYSQIPLFVEGMNSYKGNHEFNMTEQQIKGISELCNKGNGILAYDVGVGKTVCGIVATVEEMQTGKAKKPLICVPKAVYKKWIKEIHQHFPDVKVNELNNFGEKDLAKFKDADGNINLPENTLNVCTYEALQKVTFKKETLEGDLKDDMLDSQSIYDYDENGNLVADTRTDREKAEQEEKLMKLLGQSAKAKEGAVYWEDLGIDHITVDELHNFKNVFSIPRTLGKSVRTSSEPKFDMWGRKTEGGSERMSNEYQGLNGASSSRGMKLFAISQLIQRQTNGKGFFGLSATPFNNSPVEIYNILSLVARNRLKDLSIYNLQDFLREFAEMKPDWKVKADGSVENELVMKNFKNLSALQNLITEFIDKVDGEEAGVIRPYKRVHKPQLDLTPLQKLIIKAETDRMEGKFSTGDAKDDSADTLIAMNNMRMATLSPSLIDPKFWAQYSEYDGWREPKLQDIVTESPKLQFVCDMASTQYKDRPTEGQVIYMPRGVKQYNYVKDYLVKQGIPADAIAFMDSSTTLENKEKIKNDFNDPEGKIKVIIGSETIKEGVSLNGNSSTIYNTMLGWNPTETIQVEGRIWRQGNKQGVTHVVYPLMNDSIDSMMYQKYDEKSSRLNALWSYKGDSLNVEDINPEELKFELIKDPEKRADLKIKQDTADIKKQKKLLDSRYDNIYLMRQQRQQYNAQKVNAEASIGTYENKVEEAKNKYEEKKKTLDKYKKLLKNEPDNDDLQFSVKEFERQVEGAKGNVTFAKDELKRYTKLLKDSDEYIKTIDSSLKKQGIDSIDEVEGKLEQISENRQTLERELDNIINQRAELVKQAKIDIENQQRAQKHYTTEDRVKHYTKEIASDLRPFAGVKTGIETVRNMTAPEIQNVIDTIKKDGSATVGGDTFTNRDVTDLKGYQNKATVKKSMFVIKNGKFMILQKSLTYSGHKLQGKTKFSGMDISIENKKGSVRRGVDDNGHKWKIKMNYDYGYIRGTEGVDGDHVDCYIGPNENAENVYIVHQNNPDTKEYDEDKCMLGFDSLKQAKAAYLSQYDRKGFLGDVTVVPLSTFKEKIKQKKYKGKRLDL